MDSATHTRGRIGPRTLLSITAAGWAVHALALHRKLSIARRDPLTGLLRRDGYTARARQILARHGDSVLVGIVDLDHFKQINDGPGGHAAGDRVLAATAQRLTAWAGSHGTAGRLGGDEFAFAVRVRPARREHRLAQLAALLAQPVEVDDGTLIEVAASIGAACPDTLGTRDLPLLQRAADAAMYAGKHTGRAHLADRSHATVPSINGRRAGRPGTHTLGQAA